MPDKEKSQTPTEALDQVMLGILKVGAPFLNDAPSSSQTSAETASRSQPQSKGFREELMDEILAENPGLTREKLSAQMAAMGF
jgi:hypothetical protein